MIQEYIINAVVRVFKRAREENLSLGETEDLLLEEINSEFEYEDSYNLE